MWHVYLYDRPGVISLHMCEDHYQTARTLEQCTDVDAVGNCEHVRLERCACPQPVKCGPCLLDVLDTIQAASAPGRRIVVTVL